MFEINYHICGIYMKFSAIYQVLSGRINAEIKYWINLSVVIMLSLQQKYVRKAQTVTV